MREHSRALTLSIERPPADVQAFLAEPRNLPRWARRSCRSIEPSPEGWIAHTPVGPVPLRFESRENAVVIHFVYWPGQELSIPIRVRGSRSGTGTDVEISFVKPPLMSAAEFPEDVALVEQDLPMLKSLLEREGASAAP